MAFALLEDLLAVFTPCWVFAATWRLSELAPTRLICSALPLACAWTASGLSPCICCRIPAASRPKDPRFAAVVWVPAKWLGIELRVVPAAGAWLPAERLALVGATGILPVISELLCSMLEVTAP